MLYFNDLPEIISFGTDKKGLIELEVRGKVEPVPKDRSTENIVFVGNLAGTIHFVIGHVDEYQYIGPEEAFQSRDFTRLKILGICVTVLEPYD